MKREKPAKPRQRDAAIAADVILSGGGNAVVAQRYLSFIGGGGDLQGLAETSEKQARAIAADDFGSLEFMLLTQATALQAMFTDLALRAKGQDRLDAIQTMTTLALKCAAQSRQAITALAELRMPKSVLFAKQANIAAGPQQVNNGLAALSRANESLDRPNELSGPTHELLQDARAQSAASGADPQVEAVGALDRAEVARG